MTSPGAVETMNFFPSSWESSKVTPVRAFSKVIFWVMNKSAPLLS